MQDHDRKRRAEHRRRTANEIVRRCEQRLMRRFGTAWAFRDGNAHATCTHSRFDVLLTAEALATVHAAQLADETVPLVSLAAIFHAHEGSCGDGGAAAAAELARWNVFGDADGALVADAIRDARPTEEHWAAPSPVAIELGARVEAARFGKLSEREQLAAILADADRSHIGLRYGLHRALLQFVDRHRDALAVPEVSDGSELTPDPELVAKRLEEAAEAFASHTFILEMSEVLFPRRAENVERVRDAAARLRAGYAWRALLEEAARDGSVR
jgi:hypothetical protein